MLHLGVLTQESRRKALARLLAAVLLLGSVALPGCSGNDEDRARSLYATGRYHDAIEPLRAALRERPDDPELTQLLGASLLAIGRPSMAIFPLAKAAEDSEHAVEAGLLLARALISTGVGIDAIRATTRVLAVDPDNLAALTLRARANLIEKREVEAIEDIDRALALAPSDERLPLMRLEALLSLERVQEAGESIGEARRRAEEAEPPDAARAAHFCSVEISFHHERGDDEAAQALLAECLSAYPQSVQVLDAGVELFDELRLHQRSTELLKSAHESNPEHLGVRVAYANRLARSGERARGEALIRAALDDQPRAWLALLDFAADVDDPELGLEAVEGALAVLSNPVPSLSLTRADYLIRLGDPRAEEAVEALEFEVHRLAGRGRLFFERGEPARALATLERAIRLWPNNAMARYLAGLASEQLGDFERAISEYRESTRLDPAHTEAAYQLASLHASRREYLAAFHAIDHFLKSRPADERGLVLRLRIATALGEERAVRVTLARLAAMQGGSDLGLRTLAQETRNRAGAAAAIAVLKSTELDLTSAQFSGALAELTDALIEEGRQDEALGLAERARSRHPTHPGVLAVHGSVLAKLGQLESARAAYQAALDGNSRLVAALQALGAMAEAEGEPDQALRLFGRALAQRPEDPALATHVARVERSLGREQDAAERLEATLRRHPRSARAAITRALQLAELGENLDRALALARRGVLFDSSVESYEALGRVLAARDDERGAAGALKRAAALESGSLEAELPRALDAAS